MRNLLFSALFGAVSAAVVIAAAKITNRKMQDQFSHELAAAPYLWSGSAYIGLACIVLVSSLCGSLIIKYAVSWIAVVQLGLCYFAILAAAVIDYKLQIIPNFIPLALIGSRALIFLFGFIFLDGVVQDLIFSLAGFLLCGLILILGNKLSKGGIGGGDMKLLCAVGFMCGVFTVFTILLLALVCCCVLAIVGVLSKKMTLKNSVPFGPFIYLGYVLMCLLTLY